MLSDRIRIASAIAIFCVILQHTGLLLQPSGTEGFLFRQIGYMGFCEFSVSFFFVVSGYFLARALERDDFKTLVFRRACTLLIPYLIWNTVTLLALGTSGGWAKDYGITSYLPLAQGLWYLKILFLLIAISPVILHVVDVLRRHRRVLSAFQLVFWGVILAEGLTQGFIPAKKPVVMSVYFLSVGMYLFREGRFLAARGWLRLLLLAGAMGVVMAVRCLMAERPDSTYLRWWIIPLAMAVVWELVVATEGIWRRTLAVPFVNQLFNATFFVYCSEWLVRNVLYRLIGDGLPRSMGGVWLLAMLTLAVGVGAYLLLDKLASPVLGILTGGRSNR